MALTPDDLALIAALIAGNAPATPATSAPAAPVIASPFTAQSVAADARPPEIAAIIDTNAGDRGRQRALIALTLLPQWTCSVDTTADYAGETVPSALHGYTYPHKSGEPCNGVRGLPVGTACPGTVR